MVGDAGDIGPRRRRHRTGRGGLEALRPEQVERSMDQRQARRLAAAFGRAKVLFSASRPCQSPLINRLISAKCDRWQGRREGGVGSRPRRAVERPRLRETRETGSGGEAKRNKTKRGRNQMLRLAGDSPPERRRGEVGGFVTLSFSSLDRTFVSPKQKAPSADRSDAPAGKAPNGRRAAPESQGHGYRIF